MEKIPEFEKTVDLPKLHKMKLGSHEFLVNSKMGYYPYFTVELRKRIRDMKACNIVGTGEGGIGKTYLLSDLCRGLSKYYDVDNIVFTYPLFLRNVLTTKRGTPTVFDEPSYAMSKKDWYKEVTKALVKTIESFRFKGKPLFIPIINKRLLEKDIRSYLLQFHIHVTDRGKGRVYRLYPDQERDKTYRYELCKLHFDLFDNNLCDKKTCLTCNKLDPRDISKRCMVFRARYERKKIATQDKRYKDSLYEANIKDTSRMSIDEIELIAIDYFDKFYEKDKDKININLLKIVLKREHDPPIILGHNKLYELRDLIYYDYPKLFNIPPIKREE